MSLVVHIANVDVYVLKNVSILLLRRPTVIFKRFLWTTAPLIREGSLQIFSRKRMLGSFQTVS